MPRNAGGYVPSAIGSGGSSGSSYVPSAMKEGPIGGRRAGRPSRFEQVSQEGGTKLSV